VSTDIFILGLPVLHKSTPGNTVYVKTLFPTPKKGLFPRGLRSVRLLPFNGFRTSWNPGISTGRRAGLHRVNHDRERRVNSAYGNILNRARDGIGQEERVVN